MGIREGIRHHDQATIRLASLCGNDGFELGVVANIAIYRSGWSLIRDGAD
jgi:hypothetical protein